jgi:hypothetical protein
VIQEVLGEFVPLLSQATIKWQSIKVLIETNELAVFGTTQIMKNPFTDICGIIGSTVSQ